MIGRIVTALSLGMAALTSCAHPYRVSRGTLRQLTKNREPFVLVFGSLSLPKDTPMRPSIRFIHQSNRSAPEYLLHTIAMSSGDRFYAVLKAPPALSYLDEFEAEVGSPDSGYDKITYVRLRQGDQPLAMYLGEISVSPAQDRSTPGQTIAVSIRDDFQSAAGELKRLYPRFEGPVTKAPLLRNPTPKPVAPPRVR